MKITALVEALVEAGATPEQILAAVRATESQMTDALEKRRAADRDRQAKRRSHVTSRDVTVSPKRSRSRARVEGSSSPEETPGSSLRSDSRARAKAELEREFEDQFWPRYPHKVGKPAARAKFVTARKSTSLAEILAGLDRYVTTKPPDRSWLNPATFLHNRRWEDRPAEVRPNGHSPPARKSMSQRLVEACDKPFEELLNEFNSPRHADNPDAGDGGGNPPHPEAAVLSISDARRR